MLGGDDALLDLDNVGAQPQSARRFAADESDDFILDLDDEFAPATPARASSFASGQWEANRGSRAESPSATAVADAPPTERPAAEASAGRSLGLPAQSFSEIDAAGAFAEAAHGQTSTSAADDEMPTLVASSAPSFAASAAPFAAETFSVEPQAEAGFDQPMQPSSGRASLDESGASSGASGASSDTSPAATLGGQSIGVEQLSPEAIDAIARRVVEQLSERVIREIAWEVVPELAELLIKKRLEEQG